jgi:hypothetical protein
MKKRNYFPIGTAVKISKESYNEDILSPSYNSKTKIIKKRLPSSRLDFGVIVGGTYLKTGEVKYDEDGNYFTANGSIFVYLVRRSFVGKPVKVMPEDLEEATGYNRVNNCLYSFIPFSPSAFQWDENAKLLQSEVMKTVERDEKGKWK